MTILKLVITHTLAFVACIICLLDDTGLDIVCTNLQPYCKFWETLYTWFKGVPSWKLSQMPVQSCMWLDYSRHSKANPIHGKIIMRRHVQIR